MVGRDARNFADLRTRVVEEGGGSGEGGGGEREGASGKLYVGCVRSVAGGVYFVMQINARLPNHPLPAVARPPRDSLPRRYPCFPARRCARIRAQIRRGRVSVVYV